MCWTGGSSIGLDLKYMHSPAPVNGNLDVREWWKSSGPEIKISSYAIDWASSTGRIEVLDWWKSSGLEMN
ncbi:hypothetical protein BJ742DRAFT_500251 [Cladochytrium replicatum]|nr:hypothetical protein BJ742DRAFT_500251 [Cladochytrium replicatum]